ncbi:MAG: hypothetical protein L0H93_04455 [Nocardioides sp.]|nr:hypothetical protein [Nocardioides sp.]
MFKLLKIALWIGVGYVLGARAGRQRYEQIASAATRVRDSGPVQSAAPVVKDKVSTVAGAAADKVNLPRGGAHAAEPTTGPTA